jgi:TRAP transporter TatT component family protein
VVRGRQATSLAARRLGLVATLALLGCARPAGERAGAPAPVDPYATALAEGQAAWPDRGEPARLGTALDAFRRAAVARPGDPAAELWLARAEGLRALAAEGSGEPGPDQAAAGAAWDAAARAAERALGGLAPAFGAALRAGRSPAEAAALVEAPAAEPLYWLALGRMGAAQARGHLAVLAVKDHLLPLMARAAALDERLERGGPLRALGAWAAMLPTAAGGGAAEARARFDRAAELFPDEPWRRVAEAGSLAVLLQDGAAFDRLLGEVLRAAPGADPASAPELRLAQRRARALLDKRSRLF